MNGPSELYSNERTSIVVGALWMVGLSIVLFFIPVLNGVIGGLVGGYKVGSVGRAILAALLPAIVLAGVTLVTFALLDLAVLGIFAGLAIGTIVAFADLGLFLGAIIGGIVGGRRKSRRAIEAGRPWPLPRPPGPPELR